MGSPNDETYFGKRSRQNEAIPALEPPTTRVLEIDRHHSRPGFLGQENHSRSEFVGRTARSVGSNENVATRCEHVTELTNRTGSEPRGRATNHIETKTASQIGHEITVPAGTDQAGAVPLRQKFPQGKRNQEQT